MSLSRDIGLGFSTYGRAISFIFTKGLWWYFLFPLALNVILLLSGIGLKDLLDEVIRTWLLPLLGLTDTGDSAVAGFFSGLVSGVITWVLTFLLFFILAYWGGYIVIILLSPVFAFLSEKVEKILTGNDYPFNADQFMRDIVRGVLIACRNLFIETVYIVLFFIIGWIIPVLHLILTPLLFLISSYFYGFSFMDYTSERRRLSISQSVRFVRRHKGLAIANGTVFALMLLIPFCGITLAGFASIVSVVAATIAMNEMEDLPPHAPAKQPDSTEENN